MKSEHQHSVFHRALDRCRSALRRPAISALDPYPDLTWLSQPITAEPISGRGDVFLVEEDDALIIVHINGRTGQRILIEHPEASPEELGFVDPRAEWLLSATDGKTYIAWTRTEEIARRAFAGYADLRCLGAELLSVTKIGDHPHPERLD